jgi:hypothetical protein
MVPCTAMFKGSWTVLLVFAPAGKQFTSSREQMQFIISCCFQTQPPSCSRGTRPFVHRSEISEVSIHLNNMCPVYCVSFIHLFHPSLSSISFIHLFHPSLSSISFIHLFHPSLSSISFIHLFHPSSLFFLVTIMGLYLYIISCTKALHHTVNLCAQCRNSLATSVYS